VKPETIRRIDRFAGKPLCFALTCIRRLKDGARRTSETTPPIETVLFIKFIEQGATVLAYHAVSEAIARFGRSKVFFAVFEENREILDVLDLLPEENIYSIRSGKPHVFLRDWVRTIRLIRRRGIDATVDLEFFTRAPAVFSYLTRAPVRTGLHRFTGELPYRGDLMTHRVQYNPYLHVSALYTLLVRALQADPAEEPLLKEPLETRTMDIPTFKPTPEEARKVKERIRELNGGEVAGPILLLNPNASDMLPLRKWPSERFVELGRKVLQNHEEVTVIITGAPSEREAAEEIARDIGNQRVFSMAGKTTLRELIVLYTLADVLVTNDSGPSHFSALTPIEAVVLFGPETPELYGVRRSKTHIVWAGLACSPCVNVFNHRFSPCTNNRCMQAITVDEVYEKVSVGLNRGRKMRPQLHSSLK
jgi:ADP-heptose:LPS heptosyltransferase